jgi:short-subunit dehydrogenase
MRSALVTGASRGIGLGIAESLARSGHALTVVSRKSTRSMTRRGTSSDSALHAKVVAISSITGVYAEPGLAAYGASKAAVLSLVETLNAEESAAGSVGLPSPRAM